MNTRARKRSKPALVIRDGEPAAVILDIERHREMLEWLEDAEDVKEIERIRAKPLNFRTLEEFFSGASGQ